MAIKPYISSVVAKQLPEFVRSDYQTFVTFLEAYYEWLDTNYTQRNLKELRDIDDTLDGYIQYIKNELNILIDTKFPNYVNLNEREYLKYVKFLYASKGSEAAYKLLFRVLYGKEIDVFYPSSVMLRASDGKWQQDISFFVDVTGGDANDIVGKEITITDGTDITVFVERVVWIVDNIYEVFVQRFYGVVEVGNTITYSTTFSGVITGTTTEYEILNAGQDFYTGQIINIDSAEGSGTRIKISRVGDNGEIERIQIVSFGTGYETDFVVTISPTIGSFTDPSPISVSLNSVEQFNVPSNTYTEGFSEAGYITKPDYWALDYADGTYAGTILSNFTSTFVPGQDTTKAASIKFFVGAQANYPGYYSKNDGFISDSIYIQDSRYYQAYSYEIRIDELLEDYKDAVKAFIHASGTALFAEYQINNIFDLGSELTPTELQLRLYLSDSVSVTESLVKSIAKPTSDTQSITDAGTVFSMSKPVADSQSVIDSGIIKNISRVSTDTQTVTDSGTQKVFGKTLSDTQVVVETITAKDFTFDTFTDSVTESDLLTYELNKESGVTDAVSESDSGSVFLNPYTEGFYFAEDYAINDASVATF